MYKHDSPHRVWESGGGKVEPSQASHPVSLIIICQNTPRSNWTICSHLVNKRGFTPRLLGTCAWATLKRFCSLRYMMRPAVSLYASRYNTNDMKADKTSAFWEDFFWEANMCVMSHRGRLAVRAFRSWAWGPRWQHQQTGKKPHYSGLGPRWKMLLQISKETPRDPGYPCRTLTFN